MVLLGHGFYLDGNGTFCPLSLQLPVSCSTTFMPILLEDAKTSNVVNTLGRDGSEPHEICFNLSVWLIKILEMKVDTPGPHIQQYGGAQHEYNIAEHKPCTRLLGRLGGDVPRVLYLGVLPDMVMHLPHGMRD